MKARRQALLRLACTAAALAGPMRVQAVQRDSLIDPMRLAVDDALVDSGLAGVLQRAFAHHTGFALKLVRGPASSVLAALERGEHDAALTNAPGVEAALDKQGLVHDRHRIVRSDFVLVGPPALAKPLAAEHDVVLAMSRLAQAQVPFVSRPDGSGTHLAELAAWLAAKVQPAAPWYQSVEADTPLLAQARQRHACTLVERGVWLAQGSAGQVVLSEGDPRLAVDVHVMRTFRAPRQHPVGKLFVAWLNSDQGRQLAGAHRGYQAMTA